MVAVNSMVTACDMAHVPLKDASVDVAVFCLSLMGRICAIFSKEAFRVLKHRCKAHCRGSQESFRHTRK